MSQFPEKADKFYARLGKYLVAFEELVDAEKDLARCVIEDSGLKDSEMAGSLVNHLNAEEIRRTLATLLGILFKSHKYMRAVSRHLLKRVEAANRARNNMVHAYHSVSHDEQTSTTFRFSRTDGYHRQIDQVVSEKELNDRCDELWELKIIILRIMQLISDKVISPYGSFGIRGRKLYTRQIFGRSEMFPKWEEDWLQRR